KVFISISNTKCIDSSKQTDKENGFKSPIFLGYDTAFFRTFYSTPHSRKRPLSSLVPQPCHKSGYANEKHGPPLQSPRSPTSHPTHSSSQPHSKPNPSPSRNPSPQPEPRPSHNRGSLTPDPSPGSVSGHPTHHSSGR
ncbi:hypothetical protein TorRG33x02_011540, partial [Trema orientale]